MRKFLWLLAISIYFFSCKQNAESEGGDRINNISVTDLDKWHIDNATASKMIAWDTACPESDTVNTTVRILRPEIYIRLLRKYELHNIIWVKARYRDEDLDRYRQKRGLAPTGNLGNVQNHLTWIIQATSPAKAAPDYYDFVSVCPPPDPPCTY